MPTEKEMKVDISPESKAEFEKFWKGIEAMRIDPKKVVAVARDYAYAVWLNRELTYNHLSQEIFCPVCGAHGNHTSGGCPAIVKDALNSQQNQNARLKELLRQARTIVDDHSNIMYSEFSDQIKEAVSTKLVEAIDKELFPLLPHADTGKGKE